MSARPLEQLQNEFPRASRAISIYYSPIHNFRFIGFGSISVVDKPDLGDPKNEYNTVKKFARMKAQLSFFEKYLSGKLPPEKTNLHPADLPTMFPWLVDSYPRTASMITEVAQGFKCKFPWGWSNILRVHNRAELEAIHAQKRLIDCANVIEGILPQPISEVVLVHLVAD